MVHDPKRHVTLLANKKGKIFVYNKDMQVVDVITHDSKGNAISRPYGISMDSQGNYWVCDKDKGLFKITPTAGGYQAINICHNDNDPYSLSSNAAYQAVEDKQGNIWVATYGGGVNVVRKDSKSGRYIALHYKNVMGRYPHNAHRKVRTIALAKDGKVWAGSTDGILIMEIRNERITIEELQQPENMQDGLMSYDIVNLQADKQGNMWVGTNSGGLSRTDGFDDNGVRKFKNYGMDDGLPSEEIHSITIDEQDNIWFATDHVLGSLNTKKDIFSSFSNLDGVDETMCSESAAITTSDGKILFGTMYGFYTIDRKKLKTSTGSLLRLRITDFYLDDKLMSPRLDSTFQKYIPETMQVELPHSGSTIAFRFAALNYALQHRIQYQYMMEGLDDDWQNADKTRTATYEDLPYGEYMFKVKAFLLESPDAYDMRTVRVVIPPPFLLSTTAIWIYLGIIAILSIGCLLWYQNRLRRRQKQAEGTDDSKTGNADHDVANKQAETGKEPEPEQEVTDEYEIMEE
jgi:ligand-binding sensor domain-containing protein